MALQGSIPADRTEVYYSFPECYARISDIKSEPVSTFISVLFYANAEARSKDAVPVSSKVYPTTTASLQGDIYPAAYNYLKTLPDFDGWIDV